MRSRAADAQGRRGGVPAFAIAPPCPRPSMSCWSHGWGMPPSFARGWIAFLVCCPSASVIKPCVTPAAPLSDTERPWGVPLRRCGRHWHCRTVGSAPLPRGTCRSSASAPCNLPRRAMPPPSIIPRPNDSFSDAYEDPQDPPAGFFSNQYYAKTNFQTRLPRLFVRLFTPQASLHLGARTS